MREIRLPKNAVEEFSCIAREDWGREMSHDDAKVVAELFLATVANEFQRECDGGFQKPDTEAFAPGPPNRCGLCGSAKRSKRVSMTDHGPLCQACEEAISEGTLPAYVVIERQRWYSVWDLCKTIGATPAKLATLVRKGKFIMRTIPRTGFRVFLDEDQPNYTEVIRNASDSSTCSNVSNPVP